MWFPVKRSRTPPAGANAFAQILHKTPQNLNIPGKRAANRRRIVGVMGKIIHVRFRRSRLPRRLLNDGWWLETPPTPPALLAFPKRSPAKLKAKPKARYLTLVTSGK
jgi:hypothetical protein